MAQNPDRDGQEGRSGWRSGSVVEDRRGAGRHICILSGRTQRGRMSTGSLRWIEPDGVVAIDRDGCGILLVAFWQRNLQLAGFGKPGLSVWVAVDQELEHGLWSCSIATHEAERVVVEFNSRGEL